MVENTITVVCTVCILNINIILLLLLYMIFYVFQAVVCSVLHSSGQLAYSLFIQIPGSVLW